MVRRLFVLFVLVVTVGAFAVATAGPDASCEASGNKAAHCDFDGDGLVNKDDPDDDGDGIPDAEDACKWDPDSSCGEGGEEPPADDPIAELIAAICAEAPDLPICGGGETPDPEGLLQEIVDAVCGVLVEAGAPAELTDALCGAA